MAHEHLDSAARYCDGDTEQFWVNFDKMKNKYADPLHQIGASVTTVSNLVLPDKCERFQKHLDDCYAILLLQRQTTIPSPLNIAVIKNASTFLDSAINLYTNYVVNAQVFKVGETYAVRASRARRRGNASKVQVLRPQLQAPYTATQVISQAAEQPMWNPFLQQQQSERHEQQKMEAVNSALAMEIDATTINPVADVLDTTSFAAVGFVSDNLAIEALEEAAKMIENGEFPFVQC